MSEVGKLLLMLGLDGATQMLFGLVSNIARRPPLRIIPGPSPRDMAHVSECREETCERCVTSLKGGTWRTMGEDIETRTRIAEWVETAESAGAFESSTVFFTAPESGLYVISGKLFRLRKSDAVAMQDDEEVSRYAPIAECQGPTCAKGLGHHVRDCTEEKCWRCRDALIDGTFRNYARDIANYLDHDEVDGASWFLRKLLPFGLNPIVRELCEGCDVCLTFGGCGDSRAPQLPPRGRDA
jgi:hypothetical protein